LNLKRNRKLLIKLSIALSFLLIAAILLTGCVSGMAPIGWSGVTIGNNGTAFTGSKEGKLVAINLTNNSVQFSDPLKIPPASGLSCASSGGSGGACGGSAPAVAIYGSPAFITDVPIVDNTVGSIVVVAGYNGVVIAFDASNPRTIIWQYPINGNLQPIVSGVTVSGRTLYFGCIDKNVYALDVTRGIEKWRSTLGDQIWSTPVVDNNMVFVGSFDKNIYALDANSGKEVWHFPTGANTVSTPLVVNGTVYVGSLDRNLYAIDEKTGQEKWSYLAGNWFWAKPVIVNGVIFAPNLDGKVYKLDINTGKPVADPSDMGGQVSSWPVVINNQLIIATQNGKLIGLDTTNPSAGSTLISSIIQNVTAPLAAVGSIVYINGPDNNLYTYNISNGARTTVPLKQ
jgi:eukaryotic-like serine/threonine-protein kinase